MYMPSGNDTVIAEAPEPKDTDISANPAPAAGADGKALPIDCASLKAPAAGWPACEESALYFAAVDELGDALKRHVDSYSIFAVAHATASPLQEKPPEHEPSNADDPH